MLVRLRFLAIIVFYKYAFNMEMCVTEDDKPASDALADETAMEMPPKKRRSSRALHRLRRARRLLLRLDIAETTFRVHTSLAVGSVRQEAYGAEPMFVMSTISSIVLACAAKRSAMKTTRKITCLN